MEIETSSAEEISKLVLTEQNKSDKLKEAMDLAKKDGGIQGKEIDTLMLKFKKEVDDVKKALKENENYITLEARSELSGLMDALQIRVAGRGNKIYFGKNEKPSVVEDPTEATLEASSTPAEAAPETAKPRFDLSKVKIDVDPKLKDKVYTVDVKTTLNVRNSNGEITGRLPRGKDVTLTGNKKGDFVEIDKGYVSLKYLKEKLTQHSQVLVKAVESNINPTDIRLAKAKSQVPAQTQSQSPAETSTEEIILNTDNFAIGDKYKIQLLNDYAELIKKTTTYLSDFDKKQNDYEIKKLGNLLKGTDLNDFKLKCEVSINKLPSDQKSRLETETNIKLKKGESINEFPYLAQAFLIKYDLIKEGLNKK